MARREVAFLSGQYYHVFNRGVNHQDVFHTEENYCFLLKRVKKYAPSNQVAIIAYCLMPNHYHFLLRQDGEFPISDFVQAVFNSYAKAFNRAFARTGTLFEGPFRAIVVEKYEYLLYLCRYIHRNPLEAGLVHHPAEWRFSNYLEWIGKRAGTLVDMDFVKDNYPNPDEYEEFVMTYTPPADTEKELRKIIFE
jgi:REP element-mobilizing transposase RayT